MKKALVPVLAIIAVAAIVLCFVLNGQKGDLEKKASELETKIEELKAEAAKAAEEAAKAAEETVLVGIIPEIGVKIHAIVNHTNTLT